MIVKCPVETCGRLYNEDDYDLYVDHIENHRMNALVTLIALDKMNKDLGLRVPSPITRSMKDELIEAVFDGRLSKYLKYNSRPTVTRSNKVI